MRFPTRSLVERVHSWGLDKNALDHKNRNALQHFVTINTEHNLFPGITEHSHSKEHLSSCRKEILRWLISEKYDVLHKDKKENTCVITAVEQVKYAFATILVENGKANLNEMNKEGSVPLLSVIQT